MSFNAEHSDLGADSKMPFSRFAGVPLSRDERKAYTNIYLSRVMLKLRKSNPLTADELLLAEAKAIVGIEVENLMHHYAGRSQTLLAVVALFTSLLVSITKESDCVRMICITWAVISLSLFYNIFIKFISVDSKYTPEGYFDDICNLIYKRCAIFNFNIIVSSVFPVACFILYLKGLAAR